MVATKYSYSITNDFPNQKVNLILLSNEITESSITTNLAYVNTDEATDTCDIWFEDALSSGDQTILDGLVAAHQGTDTTGEEQISTSWGGSSTSSTEYQTKVSLTPSPLKEGAWEISWNAEIGLSYGNLNCEVSAQIALNDAERVVTNSNCRNANLFSGSLVTEFSEGDQPVVKLNFKVVGAGGDTAGIRRAQIRLRKQ